MERNFYFDAFVVYGWGVPKKAANNELKKGAESCVLHDLDAFAYDIENNRVETIVIGRTCQINVKSGKVHLSEEEKAQVDLAYAKYKEENKNNIIMTLGFHTALYGTMNGRFLVDHVV